MSVRLRLLVVAGCLTLTAWPTNAQTSDSSASQHARSGRPGRVSIVTRELGPLVEDGSSTAFSINNRGHVVGEATMETAGSFHFSGHSKDGFLRMSGDTRRFALDINDRDQVVGMYFLTDDDLSAAAAFSGRARKDSSTWTGSSPRRSTTEAKSPAYVGTYCRGVGGSAGS